MDALSADVDGLIAAYSTRSADAACDIGERLAARGGHKLMADALLLLEDRLDDVCPADWVSNRWDGISLPGGRCWP